MAQNGRLVISLDFELLWGIFDKVEYRTKKSYFKTTRNVIPKILTIFNDYQIHCTWATVGMLYNSNWEDWELNTPEVIPDYLNQKLSAYKYGNAIRSKETLAFCFAKDIIAKIKSTPGQEIGTHTYSHYYCLEPGQDVHSFKADLKKSIELAGKAGVKLNSLVFPRNQFNKRYLQVCSELGIKNVRSNPTSWYWKNTQNDSLLRKIFRTGDAYFGPNSKSYYITDKNNIPLAQQASRLLRPYSKNKILNWLKIRRIKSEMTYAARKKQIYHLWWHPHNFGEHPEENLRDLINILEHFVECKKRFGFQSSNMNDVFNAVKEDQLQKKS